MPSSRARPMRALFAVSVVISCLGLVACSSGGAKKDTAPPPRSTAFAPGGDSDLIVPEGHALPPELVGARGSTTRRTAAARADAQRAAQGQAQAQPARRPSNEPVWRTTGPQIRVTWEALAVERDRYENPRLGRRQPQIGAATQLKAVLVSESHVEAQTNMRGLTSRQNRGVAVAPIPDKDIQTFVQGLEQRGFFRLARPTSSVAHLMKDSTARGHITVERGGQSYTLISMRGQGLNPATKQIPAIYSEAKQSILMLRNTCSSMSVVGLTGGVLTK